MDVEFHVQDPTDPATRYLYEAIITAAIDATSWQGIYAFATRGGVDQLIADPVVHELLGRGAVLDLTVGIDAVTNRQTLERMLVLGERHPNFRPRVFWNNTRGLFHPKFSHFKYADGGQKLIVGSGNLTPNGLRHNYEAYSVISSRKRDKLDLSSLQEFLSRHSADIRPIDEEVLNRAALNFFRPAVGESRPGKSPATRMVVTSSPDRILIAQVPAAGGRWAQVHFNADITEQYFRVTDPSVQRVYLTWVHDDATRSDEEVRPVVYSDSNKNHKIEIAAAKGLTYPNTPPIVIFRELQVRSFEYMLLMPASKGYAEMLNLSASLPTIGRGMRRGITDLTRLSAAWPDCPLATADVTRELDP
jgi:HKD family nuclease